MNWLAGLEERARTVLSAPVFEYVATGARDGVSAREAGWSDVRFMPHVLRDVTDVSLATTLLGEPAAVPWGVAPTTLQGAVHPEGELAMARACAAAGSVLVVTSNAGTTFSEIGATGVRWWLQAYLPADRTLAEPMLERAVAAGAEAVVLTVDTPVVGTKYAAGEQVVWDVIDPARLGVNFDPGDDDRPGAEKATDLGPHDLGWLAEVAYEAEVYVDGGVRSGLDVLAALALGADAVLLGRQPVWALVEGEAGVARLHAELRDEVTEALRLAGCRSVADTRGIAVPPEHP